MNLLTIDLEDWYHSLDPEPANWSHYEDRIEHSTGKVLDILQETGAKATFFVLGHVAKRHPELVLELHRRGHEVASHGTEHRFVYRQSPEEFRDDVTDCLDLLKSITGQEVIGYRAPYFSITAQSLWALDVLAECGVRYDSSVFPVVNHRYGIPSAPRLPYSVPSGVVEIPPSTFPLGGMKLPIAGGAYFRLLPLRLTMLCFHRLQRRNEPIVFYLHPWELDEGQPKFRCSVGLRFRHYWGLRRTAERLRALLREFSFAPMRSYLEN